MRRIIAIGGGEIKNKTTLKIDEYVAGLIKEKANGGRGNALFVGTASHDSMPYFNSFRKTYTSVFDIKAEVALMVYGEMNMDKIKDKVANADSIYIGGGDTLYMLEKWKENGFLDILKQAYLDEKIIVGLSAGAIFHFEKMYSDHDLKNGGEYNLYDGVGTLKGCMCPHYDDRITDFDKAIIDNKIPFSYAVENDCAIEFVNEEFTKVVTENKNAYKITLSGNELIKEKL